MLQGNLHGLLLYLQPLDCHISSQISTKFKSIIQKLNGYRGNSFCPIVVGPPEYCHNIKVTGGVSGKSASSHYEPYYNTAEGADDKPVWKHPDPTNDRFIFLSSTENVWKIDKKQYLIKDKKSHGYYKSKKNYYHVKSIFLSFLEDILFDLLISLFQIPTVYT